MKRARAMAMLVCLLGIVSACVAATTVELERDAIREALAETLAASEFATTRESYEYRYRGKPLWDFGSGSDHEPRRRDSPLLELFATILARFGETILWALLIVAVVLAVIFHKRWFHPGNFRARNASSPASARVIAGLDLSPASLPDDIAGTALALWLGAEQRAALALLYRGALSILVTQRGLTVPVSATESDCVVTVEKSADPALAAYFVQLTSAWISMAYARKEPDDEHVRWLCGQWRSQFESKA